MLYPLSYEGCGWRVFWREMQPPTPVRPPCYGLGSVDCLETVSRDGCRRPEARRSTTLRGVGSRRRGWIRDGRPAGFTFRW